MTNSLQKQLKSMIIEYLSDGKEKTLDEMRQWLHEHNIKIEKNNSTLRMALYNLKQENSYLKNPKRGVYYMDIYNEEKEKVIEENSVKSKYDFSGYKVIRESARREQALVVSIMQNGVFALNSKLFALFPDREAHVIMKPDGSQLVLSRAKSEDEKIHFGKNGSTKNYDIVKTLKELKKRFPVYYVGELDEEENVWIGEFTTENPNKTRQR